LRYKGPEGSENWKVENSRYIIYRRPLIFENQIFFLLGLPCNCESFEYSPWFSKIHDNFEYSNWVCHGI
jgi:hypothetical protein